VLPAISNPADAIPMISEIKDERKEHFICLYLNARNQIIHKETVSIGSLSASIVHPREVFLVAITHSAASIILAHNHPSGDVSPSQDDIDLTHRLVRAGEIMGIEILDHIIVASTDFVSLKSRGVI
jgi:DNA repair protein RadC